MHEAFYKPLFKSMYRFGRDIETLCYFCILFTFQSQLHDGSHLGRKFLYSF